MTLKEEFEKYLQKEKEYQINEGIYKAKIEDIKSKIKSNLLAEEVSLLEELGVDFSLDLSRLSDSNYCRTKVIEIEGILKKVEGYGLSLLNR